LSPGAAGPRGVTRLPVILHPLGSDPSEFGERKLARPPLALDSAPIDLENYRYSEAYNRNQILLSLLLLIEV
jgi:hypothetical protein